MNRLCGEVPCFAVDDSVCFACSVGSDVGELLVEGFCFVFVSDSSALFETYGSVLLCGWAFVGELSDGVP